eukprot:gene27503-33925_t
MENVAPRYYLFKTQSTVYAAIEDVLRKRSAWARTSSESDFYMLLGERWEIPYTRLGSRFRQVVNHYRGSKAITIKALMVQQLRRYFADPVVNLDLSTIIPQTFLIVPGGSHADERENIPGKGIRVLRGAAEAVRFIDTNRALPAAE